MDPNNLPDTSLIGPEISATPPLSTSKLLRDVGNLTSHKL